MPRRIIPIASGKGGVGKTTFAVNFALGLARTAPTVLVDLDTGTSSVRGVIQVPITKDLYHFKRQGAALSECITRLDDRHDPRGEFRNFGFIAGPRHFMEDISNPDAAFRRSLATEINRLPAEFVVLDLRAGLDPSVLDFLPFTNSGILVFTPHHPAATLAAADIVKAILFRSLRILFREDSPLYAQPEVARYRGLVLDLLARVEDVYDPALPNLDSFLVELAEAFGRHPIVEVLTDLLDSFRVHYVLNMFNGVEHGFEGAVVPMVESLAENVSSRIEMTQLGWVVQDDRVQESNRCGYPILLDRRERAAVAAPPVDKVAAELQALESSFLGLHRRKKVHSAPLPASPVAKDDLLGGQLDSLRRMYTDRRRDTVRDNFSYMVFRALNLMGAHASPAEFGTTALATADQMQRWFLRRQGLQAQSVQERPPDLL
jgi:MinD-like ATPase involved in chromosome partitioning or flagellar assembly